MITIDNPIGKKIEHFKDFRKIGSGGFATVYKAKCRQSGYENDSVAIKIINKKEVKKNKKLRERVEKEIEIHSALKHSSIVRFFTWFEDKNSFYLVLELCENGTLEEYVKDRGPLPEKDACDIIKQIIDGVKYLHSKSILHRDLSLKNILLTRNMKIKIADFGLATKLNYVDEKKQTMLGTANFISPEIVQKQWYDFKTDCWSVGCVLYALLYGSPPFDGKEKKYTEIMKDAVMSPLKFPSIASMEAKDLLEGLLNKNPDDRINILDLLQYPFFKKYEKSFDVNPKFSRNCNSSLNSLLSSASALRCSGLNVGCHELKRSQNSLGCNEVSDFQRLHVNKLSSCHSGSCNDHVLCENQPCVHSHSETRPRLKSVSSNRGFVSVNHLKNKINKPVQSTCSNQDCNNVSFEPHEQFQYVSKTNPCYHNRCENKLDNLSADKFPIEKPLPYPSLCLQNSMYNQSHITYSDQSNAATGYSKVLHSRQHPECFPRSHCSHEYHCTPDNYCSHEIVCACRHSNPPGNGGQNSCHFSQPVSEQKNVGCIELVLDRSKEVEQRRLKDIVKSQLTTVRLPPKRYTTKNAIVSILNDGQVCLEFFKLKKNQKVVINVCFISRDGWTILLYKPKKGLVPTNEPPPLPNNLHEVQYFNFETLPEPHWKKYQYAKRFIDIVRAKTPKVIIYNKECKCVMMENGPEDPDYEINLHNGCTVTYIGGKTTFTDQKGYKVEILSQNDLSAHNKHIWDLYTNMKEKCEAIEASMEKLFQSSSDTNDTYFPVVIGRRSNGPLSCKDLCKENTTPQSQHSSALNRAISAMTPYDCTMTTDCSPLQNSSQHSLSKTKLQYMPSSIKSIFKILQNLKDLPKVENDKIVAEYKDGIQMWSSKNGQEVYFYDTQNKKKITDTQDKDLVRRYHCDLTGILLYILSSEGKRKR